MSMWQAVLVAFLGASACSFDGSNVVRGGGGGDPDGATDSMSSDCVNVATYIDPCTSATHVLSLTMPGVYQYNTDNGTLLDPQGEVVEHSSLLINAANGALRTILTSEFLLGGGSILRADGAPPLAISASHDLVIQGSIDVGVGGAGARASCGLSNGGAGGDLDNGAGGGGGGGFQGVGGRGGQGNDKGFPDISSNHGDRGVSGVATMPTSPVGGCSGGAGGDGDEDGGIGGPGGGAIYLVSGSALLVSGAIAAGGGGGGGAAKAESTYGGGGGGGGGSGGYILLEAPEVLMSGTLVANGGGGGEGAGDWAGGLDGAPGIAANLAAAGGSGGASWGADGGSGSAATVLDGRGVTEEVHGGGGGGGGAAGFVLVSPGQSLAGVVSPPSLEL